MPSHQIIKTPSGDELVVLPRAEYDALVRAAEDAAEDAADIAMYDRRKADAVGAAALPAPVSDAILAGDSVIKAWRKYRKMSQSDLAAATGLAQGFISDLESGRRSVTPATAEKLAQALDVAYPGMFETTEIPQ